MEDLAVKGGSNSVHGGPAVAASDFIQLRVLNQRADLCLAATRALRTAARLKKDVRLYHQAVPSSRIQKQ